MRRHPDGQEVDGVVLLAVGVGWCLLVVMAMHGRLDRTAAVVADTWRRIHPRPPVPETGPVEQLAADLRRLAAHLEAAYDTDQPAKMERLTAAALAYDWVLLSACRTLEVPAPPPPPPLAAMSRLQVEAALARRGLDW
jgi:hypothetical protein